MLRRHRHHHIPSNLDDITGERDEDSHTCIDRCSMMSYWKEEACYDIRGCVRRMCIKLVVLRLEMPRDLSREMIHHAESLP